ncbi:MAG: FkbM family methyltransferase [Sphingobacteriales bacterium]|nr:MAG: FkbM family methyltransferase [Sphingobacteriales bacterium]
MKETVKKIIKAIPIAFTQNQRYDKQTKKIIARVCKADSNCIDVGAHKGEVLDIMLKHAPNGMHHAFEPIPDLYTKLASKYGSNKHCRVYDLALNNEKGTATFNYVVSNPSYSGLIKRKYDRPDEQDTQITVKTELLDDALPADVKIDLIKIDVEGGELRVLEGARQTLKRNKPVVIFEHGLGASDFYGSTPDKVYKLMEDCGLKISRMKDWLDGKNHLSLSEFETIYKNGSDYYFIAHR